MELTARRPVAGVVAVLAVWAVAGAAVITHGDHTVIAAAAAFDFVVTASLVAWWLKVPRWASTGTLVGGLVLAKLASHGIVMAVAVEAVAIGSVIKRKRHGVIARLLRSELHIFSMLIVGWRKAAPAITVHRLNGWSLHAGVLAFSICVEAVPIHIAIAHASPLVAWLVSATSIYSALWLIGDALALRHGGIRRLGDELDIRIGVRHHVRIPVAGLSIVERCEATSLAVGAPNVWLRLANPATVESLFGRRRTTSAIALSVDDLDGFCTLIR